MLLIRPWAASAQTETVGGIHKCCESRRFVHPPSFCCLVKGPELRVFGRLHAELLASKTQTHVTHSETLYTHKKKKSRGSIHQRSVVAQFLSHCDLRNVDTDLGLACITRFVKCTSYDVKTDSFRLVKLHRICPRFISYVFLHVSESTWDATQYCC